MNGKELSAPLIVAVPETRICLNCDNCSVETTPGVLNPDDATKMFYCGYSSCVDLVTGDRLTCFTARSGPCGIEGVFFTPRVVKPLPETPVDAPAEVANV